MVAGGINASTNATLDTVQVFDVSGNCSKNLRSLPMKIYDLVIGFLNGQMIVCGGANYTYVNSICWSYNTALDNWNYLTAMSTYPLQRVGIVYQNKLYIPDDISATVFDPLTNTWAPWQSAPLTIGVQICSLAWQDGLFLMGLNKSGKLLFSLVIFFS